MPKLPRLLFILLLALCGTSLHARQADAPASASSAPTPEQTLKGLQHQLEDIKQGMSAKHPDKSLGDLRNEALDLHDRASQLVQDLAPAEKSLQAQLRVFGPLPSKGAPAESRQVRQQRRELDLRKASLDAQLKQAQLLAQTALQTASQMSDLRRNDFQARLASRTPTPFSRAFWKDSAQTLPGDLRRLSHLGDDVGEAFSTAWQPPNRTPFLACVIAAFLLVGVLRIALEAALLRLTTRRVPAGHLRRSALAAAIALLTSLTTGVAAGLVYLGINWHDHLDSDLENLCKRIIWLIALSAYIAGLGRALISSARPTWRLTGLADPEARRLRAFPWLLAVVVAVFGLIERVNSAVGASLPLTVTVRGATTLILTGIIGMGLVRLSRTRRQLIAQGTPPPGRPLWVGLILAGAMLAVVGAWLAVISGFIALGFYLAVLTLWVAVVVGSLYLLMHLINDGFALLLSPQGRNGQRLQQNFDLSASTLEQTRTVLSGVTRSLFVLLAIASVVAQFTASPSDLFSSLGAVFGALKLGHMTLTLGDFIHAILVIVIGLIVLRIVKRWLIEDLLPETSMDPGMQSSVVTLLGYVGVIAVFVLALAALQVSLQNITWIASALSVGIGFGLQAIVQNFISGLILLAERPVKVGDWVSLNGVEGDIRRINVRATEIQLWDRSTVIVPNSQLITENVRNVTLAKALGRVYFLLPMPLDTDAERVRQIMLDTLHEHPAVLDEPSPTVRLDSVDTGAMHFSVIGYLNSPREVVSTRSDLLLAILARLREARVRMIRPQEMQLQRGAAAAANVAGENRDSASSAGSAIGSIDQP